MKPQRSSRPQGTRSAAFPVATPGARPASAPRFPASSPATTDADDLDFVETPAAQDTVRILLSLDVPASALPGLEADWSLVGHVEVAAPTHAAELTALALDRLFAQVVKVNGVAAVQPVANPFARWLRAAA